MNPLRNSEQCRICSNLVVDGNQRVVLVGEDRAGFRLEAVVHRWCLARPIEEFTSRDAVRELAERKPEAVPEEWR